MKESRCQGGLTIWLTGMSGAGKTTIANVLKDKFAELKHETLVIDGDFVRSSINKKLGFSKEDIVTNNRSIIELCLVARKQYDFVIVPVISPFLEIRAEAKDILGPQFLEVFVKCDIESLSVRDTKGLYAQERQGLINNLIGVSRGSPYEPPMNPDVVLNSGKESVLESVNKLMEKVMSIKDLGQTT